MTYRKSFWVLLIGLCLSMVLGFAVFDKHNTETKVNGTDSISQIRATTEQNLRQEVIREKLPSYDAKNSNLAKRSDFHSAKSDEKSETWEDQWVFRENFNNWLKNVSPKGLTLSKDEKNILAREIYNFMKVSGKLKETAPMSISRDGDATVVEIPARPDLALAMWDVFTEQLSKSLTEEQAAKVVNAIGWHIAAFLNGLGAADETYRVTLSRSGNDIYEYSYSAVIPSKLPDEVEKITRRYRGSTESGSATFAELASRPNYAFLKHIL